MKKITKTLIIEFLLVLSLSNLTMAFGVTPPYWKDRPLTISPGEEKIVPIILQNMAGEKDIILKAEIISGKEIAEILEAKEYLVPLRRNDVKVEVRIKIPEKTKDGKYTLSISFTEIPRNEGEMLQISGSTIASFPIIVQKDEQKSLKSIFLVSAFILIILILILIISIFLIKAKKVL